VKEERRHCWPRKLKGTEAQVKIRNIKKKKGGGDECINEVRERMGGVRRRRR